MMKLSTVYWRKEFKINQEELVLMKEDIMFVDYPISNSDLVLALRKIKEVDIEWGEIRFESEESDDQLAHLELESDFVNMRGLSSSIHE